MGGTLLDHESLLGWLAGSRAEFLGELESGWRIVLFGFYTTGAVNDSATTWRPPCQIALQLGESELESDKQDQGVIGTYGWGVEVGVVAGWERGVANGERVIVRLGKGV